ncbi:WecB/TagA/CpsF family glycosyltransferase [Consotaella salsifontis]|uniref:Polymer biosynthesis protein, WecB/TagA/CpsF family n=1 Tax=Consotaella salsifontis TaxID=1365950 RepID=A0A1T4Q3K0_9HYPH|nr:WecB/TagA/CpsF family glycosyltransferase [Consotaella salsifontis]SJZ98097.1 polymer biosynthesis protein, WecB/TagA/CpsF family [Consotaella salsifontis]
MTYALPLAISAASVGPAEVRAMGDVDVMATNTGAVISMIEASLATRSHLKIAFVNAHCFNVAAESSDYRDSLGAFLVLPDGIGMDIASRALFGEAFPENLNGTDLTPAILERIGRPLRVALVGGEPGVVETAARHLAERYPRHAFLPVSHGYFGEGSPTMEVLARLRSACPDLVLVGLSVPRQELFIARHMSGQEGTVVMAIGAFLDFAAGKVPRAPAAVRLWRLEWAFRLAIEPRRLWRRYVVGNPAFLLRVALLRFGRARAMR